MNYLSNRYQEIVNHKGIAICALKEAVPANGDELGYVLDHEWFEGKVYDHPGEAAKAVDQFLSRVENVLDSTGEHRMVDVVRNGTVVSNYDGRNSIDLAYNDCEVKEIKEAESTMTIYI